MSQLKVFNTLTATKEDFVPLESKRVRMYSCGPTVYDLSHLGHARNVIVFDVVQRYLRFAGYDVTFVRNITDIEDKIINRAREQGITPEKLARGYTYTFWHDMHTLNVLPPDVEPRATEFIRPMLEFVEGLLKKGHAYVSAGDVYFDVASFPSYGKLKKQSLDDLLTGAREQVRSQEELKELKRNPVDFALWKGAASTEPGWESPWGHGRPGWHLECSTMIRHVLGETIDIHAGGEDLVFPHHENEIAQSEALTGKPLARYWLHNSFVRIDAEKMSKSLGNFLTIQDVLRHYSPDTIRMFVLQTHYRKAIEYSSDSLDAARSAVHRLVRALHSPGELPTDMQSTSDDDLSGWHGEFIEAMNNDFNTPVAISVLFAIADKIFATTDTTTAAACAQALRRYAELLGLTLLDTTRVIDADTAGGVLQLLLELRDQARLKKDYAAADLIRNRLQQLGVQVMDSPAGSTWEKA
jgi:cysteinyl-tRNA synthetase